MSGESYPAYSSYFHHSPNAGSYPISTSSQSWNNWNLQQQQYMQNYVRSSATYNANSVNHNNHSNSSHSQSSHNSHSNFRSQGYHPAPSPHNSHSNRPYYRSKYSSSSSSQYTGSSNWPQRSQGSYKRNRLDSVESEPQLKTSKKKKKPLSQNIPNKKDWTIEEAQHALDAEKEHNKKSKNALIIKFPDQELNKDIVANFHPMIENVHFQQPCTPRFCFVTLKESANPDELINILNKQKFGEGCLIAEYKKDREEDQAINVEDIDPLTLYVGNLAQEVTKEDMVNMYPHSKRIDIGFAKKMKFTRYAFVSFRNVSDSIEAFKRTHNTQMYNKSLIVRFRRLHGTVGMPGESKPQNPPKSKEDLPESSPVMLSNENTQNSPDKTCDKNKSKSSGNVPESSKNTSNDVIPLPDEVLPSSTDILDVPVLDKIKQEQPSPSDSGDEIGIKSALLERTTPFLPADVEEYNLSHRPILKEEIKSEIKKEKDSAPDKGWNVSKVKVENNQASVRVKDEPYDPTEDVNWGNGYYGSDDSDDGDDNVSSSVTDFDRIYESMVDHANKISSLKKADT